MRNIFDTKFGVTSGPNVPLFQRFKISWPTINTSKYKPGIKDTSVLEKVQGSMDNILQFCLNQLKLPHYREDYREILEITVIFLNGVPPRGISFRTPGAIHHARWMSKALYSLKIFIFREEFKLTKKEYNSISSICIFIINLYVKAWFNAPIAAFSPHQDLEFFKSLYEYKNVDEELSKSATKKFVNHLWYLTSENILLAFFDKHIYHVKQKLKWQ